VLDRVDLRLEMLAAGPAQLREDSHGIETSETVRARVADARRRSAQRLSETPWRVNAEVPGPVLRRTWALPWETVAQAERELDRGTLTARGLDRVLRVAWTLADLAGRDRPDAGDVRVALEYRGVQWRSA
jgi:magnesium chelatase family protein